MLVSVYYELSLFNAHTLIMFVHSYTHVNKQCLKQHSIMFKKHSIMLNATQYRALKQRSVMPKPAQYHA